MSIDECVRRELARRARDKNRRQNTFTSDAPCDWRPWQVLHPQAGVPFNDVTAWNFIADQIDGGHEISTIIMKKPAGQIGYVMVFAGFPGCPDIYVKLTLGPNKINGRSFHESEY